MAKFEKRDNGGKKKIILAVVITLLVIIAIVGGYFLYKGSMKKQVNIAFSLGYNKSLQDVAQGQTQTGSILVWQNDSIEIMAIADICNQFYVPQGQ